MFKFRDKRRAPLQKIPERCDPADPQPHAAYTGAAPQLSVDERIREVVRQMTVGQVTATDTGPTEEDLRVLEELGDDDDLILSESQIRDMTPEPPGDPDFHSFLQTIEPNQLRQLKEALDTIEEVEGGGAADPEAPPTGGSEAV